MKIIEVAARLGVHKSTVRRWIGEGRLTAVKSGEHWRVPWLAVAIAELHLADVGYRCGRPFCAWCPR